jgi:hypothetical protein
MTYESRRNILVGLTAFVIAGCGGKEDRGVENIRRELSYRLNAELKGPNLSTKTVEVKVSKIRDHAYSAEITYDNETVIIDLPEGFDMRRDIIPKILDQLKIPRNIEPKSVPKDNQNKSLPEVLLRET